MFFRNRKTSQESRKDWAGEAADHIERAIDVVRDKAVVPLMTIARALVYGTLAGILGLIALILVSILFVRILDIYLHNISWMPDGVWITYAVSGSIFVLTGLILWSKRTAKSAESGN